MSKIVNFLKENNGESINIKGYASEEGEEYVNLKLSGERVKNVYTYLLTQGVSRNQMISIIQGEASEHRGVDQKEKNSDSRRVTIILK